MDTPPCRPRVPNVDDAPQNIRLLTDGAAALRVLELETENRQLQAELSEAKRAEEEIRVKNRELELRVAEESAELAAVRDELRQELERRMEDHKKIFLLNEDLARQKKALDIVSQELELFNYSISHDLRAPLRHLAGFSGALSEDYGDQLDGTAKSFLDCIAKAGRKMELQIEALLNLSRLTRQELTLANVDLSHLVRECAVSLQGAAPERRAVFNIVDKLLVRGDAALLKAAVACLLGNAWKYTVRKEAAAIEFGQQQDGDATVFYLRDNGVGFDMKYADRLFGPFQRMHTDNEFEGIGVGLATAQRIIRRHGGRIWAEATVEGGATFFFTLSC